MAVDILERLDPEQATGAFRLIEVKATSSLKDEHIPDAAVELHVLRKAGIDVREVALMRLNKAYRHPGSEDLFVLDDITEQAEAFQPEIPALLDFCRAVPDLTYEGMEVADGMTASVRLARVILEPDTFSDEAREAERRALLEHCKLDTLAMVE